MLALREQPRQRDLRGSGVVAGRAPGPENVNQHHLSREARVIVPHGSAFQIGKGNPERLGGIRAGYVDW